MTGRGLLAGAVLAAVASSAAAQLPPDRPVTLIGAYTAGGNSDIALRALGDAAARASGRRFVIENKAGASGSLAAANVVGARPDGLTLAQTPITVFRMPHLGAKYDPRSDFSWVIGVAGYRFGVTVRADSPWKTWQELVAYAKANPGKLSYATPGSATSLHITMEDIAEREGIKWTQVPFKGTSDSVTALRGGHVQIVAGTPPYELVAAGQMRALNVWTEQRSQRAPDVPTLKELGYGIVSTSPWGIAGPRGIPSAAVRQLHDLLKKAVEDPAFVTAIERLDQDPAYMSTEQYTRFALEAYEREKRVVEKFGLKP